MRRWGGVVIAVALALLAITSDRLTTAATPGAVYLPNVTKTLGGLGGWTTPIVVQNTGNEGTTISAALYRFSDGAYVTTLTTPRLVAGQAWTLDLAALPQVPHDTQFAAVVTAATGTATAIVLEGSGGQGWMSYGGTSGGSGTVYLPNITRTLGGPDGWTTPFIVQNLGGSAATASVSFYRFADGSLARRIDGVAIAPGRSQSFVPQIIDGLSDDAQYSVVVQGSAGSELYAIVNEHQGAQAMSYEGLLAGAQNLYLPYLQKYVGGTGGWSSPFIVQNVGTAQAVFSISFYSVTTGALAAQIPSVVLEPGRSFADDVRFTPASLPAGEFSAVIRGNSGAKLAAIVNQQHLTNGLAMSYAGATSLATALYAPYVAKRAGNEQWYSGLVVQNAGAAATDVTVQILDVGDGSTKQTKIYKSVAPGASVVHSAAAEPALASYLAYSAVVTAGQPITAVVNATGSGSGDLALSYLATAVPPPFAAGVDPARTGITGVVKWTTGEPAAGLAVRVADFRGPGDSRPVRTYGTATTAADGSYTVVGIPPGTEYGVETGSSFSGMYQQYPIVANQVVRVGEISTVRQLVISPADGSSVAAGAPLTITWNAVPNATVYCLLVTDATTFARLNRPSTACGGYRYDSGDGAEEVRETRYVTPALTAGRQYSISIAAFARTAFEVNNPALAEGLSTVTAR